MTRSLLPATRLAAALALCLAAIPAAHANLLTNGGFETQNSTPAIPPPGWSASGTGMAVDSAAPQAGLYDIAFTALSTDASPGILSQSVATTAGQGYTLSFWLLDQNPIPANDAFVVTFGGFTDTILGSSLALATYTNVTLAIAGTNVTGASTTLGFQGLLDPLGGGLPLNLDTVSLTANVATIPEPATVTLFGAALALAALFTARRRQSGHS